MNLFLINLASQTNFEFWRPGQITHFCIPGRKITIFVCNFISDAVALEKLWHHGGEFVNFCGGVCYAEKV